MQREKKTVSIVSDYRDLTIGKYTTEILPLVKKAGDMEPLDLQVALIAALNGMTEQEVLNLPVPEYTQYALATKFLERPLDMGRKGRIASRYTLGDFVLIPVRDFEKMTAGIAANYGSRREITQAVREIAALVRDGRLDPADISEETISQHLYTREMPDVDLLIRPGGEQRISNFLLWQSAYAEFYFCDTLWPDFTPKEFDKAIVEYAKRTRRFGAV